MPEPGARSLPARPTVRVDPELAEAAVRIVVGSPAAPDELREVHRARLDAIYEVADPAARSRAFARLAVEEFGELELATPLIRALAQRPTVSDGLEVLLVGEAVRREEGITCEPGGRHLGVRLDAARLADPDGLLAWADHALGHAADTLDSAFGFTPGWEEGATGRVPPVVQARLHRLWDVSVDARLAADGRLDAGATRARHRARIAADLPSLPGEIVDAVLDRLWAGERPAFAVLLAWATRPADMVAAIAPGTVQPRPDRCPLCRFPGDDVDVPDATLAAAVARDYPAWDARDGLCGRCADRYRFAGALGGAR